VVAREHGNIHRSGELNAAALVRLLERCDACASRRALPTCCWPANATPAAAWASSRPPYPQRPRLLAALAVAQGVATAELARAAQAAGAQGAAIGQAVAQARARALQAWLDRQGPHAA
jgi:tRNA nucleotidyltransferase (CCA-adding enzyme)